MKLIVFICAFMFLKNFVSSQVIYEEQLPVPNTHLYNILNLSDGTVLSAGRLNNSLLLVNWDNNGDTLWTRYYSNLPASGIRRHLNSELIAGTRIISEQGDTLDNLPTAGTFQLEMRQDSFIYSNALGNGEVELTMMDRNGIVHWTQPLIQPTNGSFRLGRTTEGFLSCTASSTLFPNPSAYIHLSHYDLSGNFLDSSYIYQSPSGAATGISHLIHPSSGGTLILVDYAFPEHTFLIRTDQHGDTLWTRQYGYWMEEYPENILSGDLQETPVGTFLIGGMIDTPDGRRPRLIEYDQDGMIICIKTLSQELFDGIGTDNSIVYTDSILHMLYAIWDNDSSTNLLIGHSDELCSTSGFPSENTRSTIRYDPLQSQIHGLHMNSQWMVFSTTGQLLENGIVRSNPATINLPSHVGGLYVLKVIDLQDNVDYFWKIVKVP
jgi:hypothetical protein